MGFLSPWFLAGLLALAVPLALHRLARRTADERPWSSLAFFRPEIDESVRQRRFRYLALMGSRLSLLALLALLFARPVFRGGALTAEGTSSRHLLAIDTSLSMDHGDGGARARRIAGEILAGLGGAERSQLLAFGPGVRILGAPEVDHGAWRGVLDTVVPTASRATYGELGEAVRTLAEEERGPIVLHVISDFQRSAAPERFADMALPPGTTLRTHDVAAGSRPNWLIEGVAGQLLVHGEEPVRLDVTVAGHDTEAATRRVTVVLEGREASSREVAVPPSGRATVTFPDLELPRGRTAAEVRITPTDGLAADDRFFVRLERDDPQPVLFLRSARDIRAEVYYRAALEAGGGGRFDLRPSTPEAAQTLSLDAFSFVVIHDVPVLPALLERRLTAFAESGRSLFLILGATAAREGKAAWLGQRLADGGRAEHPRSLRARTALPELFAGAAFLEEVRFYRQVRAEAGDDETVADLGDAGPLLFTRRIGGGRLLVLTSPLDTTWNEWPVHASFVPFVFASARWLAGLDDVSSSATVDQVRDLGGAEASPASSIEVIDPAGRPALGFSASVTHRKVTWTQAGFYEVRRPGRTETVAVNPDRRESDLRPLEAEVRERWAATGTAPAVETGAVEAAAEREISGLLVWALVAALFVESTLANRYLRP